MNESSILRIAVVEATEVPSRFVHPIALIVIQTRASLRVHIGMRVKARARLPFRPIIDGVLSRPKLQAQPVARVRYIREYPG